MPFLVYLHTFILRIDPISHSVDFRQFLSRTGFGTTRAGQGWSDVANSCFRNFCYREALHQVGGLLLPAMGHTQRARGRGAIAL